MKTLYLRHSSRLRIIGEYFEGAELKPSIKKEALPPEEIKPVMAAKEPAVNTQESKQAEVKDEPTVPVEEMKPVLAEKEALSVVEESKPAPIKKEPRPAGKEKKDVTRMLDSWKKAWEQKNLVAYMSFYDSGFRSRGMDFKAWKKHREKLNQKHRSITVDITDFKIERTSAVMASVSFTQKYEADDYEDEGLKSLLLVKRGKDWKIKEEEWKPLDQESRP
jgi:hypothetical protein